MSATKRMLERFMAESPQPSKWLRAAIAGEVPIRDIVEALPDTFTVAGIRRALHDVADTVPGEAPRFIGQFFGKDVYASEDVAEVIKYLTNEIKILRGRS